MIRIADPTAVGAVVADLRAMSRLTQRELCDQVGMDPSRLSGWGNGHTTPTLAYLVPVLRVLGYQLVITLEEDTP